MKLINILIYTRTHTHTHSTNIYFFLSLQGNFNDHRFSTNNARYEGLIQSKLYSKPLNAGNRCVVVCDGFYEWQTKIKGEKHPYFIYMTQDDGVCFILLHYILSFN